MLQCSFDSGLAVIQTTKSNILNSRCFFSRHVFLQISKIKSTIIKSGDVFTLQLSCLCKVILVYYHQSFFFFFSCNLCYRPRVKQLFHLARKKISFLNYQHCLNLDFFISFASAKSFCQKTNVRQNFVRDIFFSINSRMETFVWFT